MAWKKLSEQGTRLAVSRSPRLVDTFATVRICGDTCNIVHLNRELTNMDITAVRTILSEHTDGSASFEVDGSVFIKDGRSNYTRLICDNVKPGGYGIYIWVNESTNEIVYIGMAGKVKNNGSLGKQCLQKRLLAPRGKDKITKKYTGTEAYLDEYMSNHSLDKLVFHVFFSKAGIPPSYLEAVSLYEHLKSTGRLPILNAAF